MRVDRQTLADLEILESSDGGPGIFDLVDRTATSFGRAALRRRFREPLTEPSQIRAVQGGVRWLAENPGHLKIPVSYLDAVDRYLRSNVLISSHSRVGIRLEELWMSVRYRDLLREIRTGVEVTRELLSAASRVSSGLLAAAPPTHLQEFGARLGELLSPILEGLGASSTVLGADRVLRIESAEEVREALLILGQLDALYSMAEVTEANGWVFPEIVEGPDFVLEATGVTHPFLAAANGNPIDIQGGEALVFLTGPNMAGKTTYLRSVALLPFLAQIGMGTPASSARLTPIDVLFTSINPRDNLREGISFFMSEVLRVREAAATVATGARCFMLFDEVFKGTNVRDALESSEEVILGLGRARNSGFVFSSHLSELGEKLKGTSGVQLRYFDGEIVESRATFDYTIREGVSDKRFGRLLLEQAGVPDLLRLIRADR